MERKYNRAILPFARELRKNMTKEENHLWYDFLKQYPVQFNRQKVIGNYIVDFYCPKAKLVIELDGAGHFTDEGHEQDKIRDAFMAEYKNLTVLRFSNSRIKYEFKQVCEEIADFVEARIGAETSSASIR